MNISKTFERIILIIIGLTLGWGVAIGVGAYADNNLSTDPLAISALSNHIKGQPEKVDFSLFWEIWQILENRHVDSRDAEKLPTAEERVEGAIQGLIRSFGDPYTVFLPPEDKKQFDEDVSGSFGGVGMEIGLENDILTVISPLSGTPADRAGILSGDKIIEVDGESTAGMSVEQAVRIIRGEKGTEVVLTIFREGEESEIPIIRDIISIPTIDTELDDSGVFIIKLYNFSEQAPTLFRQAMREFSSSRADKLVIDLRGNPGGYLGAAVDIASYFLPAGEIVVSEVRADGGGQTFRSRGYGPIDEDIEIVVLIDRGSASGSEILAGALADHNRATLIGGKTFGKGSVQELMPIGRDSSLKITIARWLTPSGDSISEGGLTPDIEVEFNQEAREAGEDPQMDRAIEFLNQ